MPLAQRVSIRRTVARLVRHVPTVYLPNVAGARWSVLGSADDLYALPNLDLVDLLLEAASAARHVDLGNVAERCGTQEAAWVHLWPGEHYRLLAALIGCLKPDVAVEIGTYKGIGALSLAAGNQATKVVTYDLFPWETFEGSALNVRDLVPAGPIEQRIGDLADPQFFAGQVDTLRSADLLFVDGPKDGRWEYAFCDLVLPKLTDRRRLVVFDDIYFLEMVELWRNLPYPKLDGTSLGHWSGTGLIHTVGP